MPMILALILQHAVLLTDKSEGKWEASAAIPAFLGKDPVSKLARATITERMTQDFKMFLAEAKRDWIPGYESAPYAFESGGVRQLGDTRAQSYTLTTYRYMGGAHGLGVTTCANFALVGGRPRVIRTQDVFVSTKTKQLTKLILDVARKDPNTDWLQAEGDKTTLTSEELSNFWVDPEGVTWEFDPYQLGSYASGAFSFKFKWRTLGPYLRRNHPFASIMKP